MRYILRIAKISVNISDIFLQIAKNTAKNTAKRNEKNLWLLYAQNSWWWYIDVHLVEYDDEEGGDNNADNDGDNSLNNH